MGGLGFDGDAGCRRGVRYAGTGADVAVAAAVVEDVSTVVLGVVAV